jgi:hypothetical protein
MFFGSLVQQAKALSHAFVLARELFTDLQRIHASSMESSEHLVMERRLAAGQGTSQ